MVLFESLRISESEPLAQLLTLMLLVDLYLMHCACFAVQIILQYQVH
jgi:hypothetical protein